MNLATGVVIGDPSVTYTNIAQICAALAAGTLSIAEVTEIIGLSLQPADEPTRAQIAEVIECLAALFPPA